MDAKDLLRQKLVNIRNNLMEVHRDSQGYAPSIAGAEREIIQRRLLSLVLPSGYRVGSGTIIDASGRSSGQVDAVIEQPFSVSFPISSEANRLYLASTVCAAFEIKSNLISQKEKALEKIRQIRTLHRMEILDGEISSGDHLLVPAYLIGFKGPKTLDQLENQLIRPDRFYPSGVLVIESGLYYGRNAGGGWRMAEGPAASIMAFLACLLDTIRFTGEHQADIDRYKSLVISED